MIAESIQDYLRQLADRARSDGAPLFVVGGALRDRCLGRPVRDIDFAGVRAPELAKPFAKSLRRKPIVLDSTPGRETIRVAPTPGVTFDFSRLQGSSIESDLARRDFTINAMAQSLNDFQSGSTSLLDPHGGQSDLAGRVVRALPGSVLEDDPLRMLRAFRFAAELRFDIDSATLERIGAIHARIGNTAPERILYELTLFLGHGEISPMLRLMSQTRLLQSIFPEIGGGAGLERTLQTFAAQEALFQKSPMTEADASLSSLAALLLHGSGTIPEKTAAPSRRFDTPAAAVLRRLRASNETIQRVGQIIRVCGTALETKLQFAAPVPNRTEIYRYAKQSDAALRPGLTLAAASRSVTPSADDARFLAAVRNIERFYVEIFLPAQDNPPLLDGDDLAEKLHLKPSPLFRNILGRIEEKRVLGEIHTRAQAEQLAQEIIREHQPANKK